MAAVAATSVALVQVPLSASADLQIAGFDLARGGDMSIVDGPAIAQLRAEIVAAFPNVSMSGASILTDEYLQDKDIVVISAVYSAQRIPITPLTPDEQLVLRRYVQSGGHAILLADNDDYAAASQSLLDPVLMTVGGYFGGAYEATVDDPYAQFVTHGPFGVVSEMPIAIVAEILDLGPDGTALASFRIGSTSHDAIGLIDPGRIEIGSGQVLAFADTSMVFDALRGPDTTELILNALYMATGCRADINQDGIVDTRDVLQFLGMWVLGDSMADWNQDGTVNTLDFLSYLNNWAAGC